VHCAALHFFTIQTAYKMPLNKSVSLEKEYHMNIKNIILLYIIFYTSLAFSIEKTTTSELVQSSTDFYTQSSSGNLSTCGIEFSGVDSQLNYFSGSFSLLIVEDKNFAAIFKIKSSILNIDGTRKTRKLKSAWLESSSFSTLSSSWESKRNNDYIVAVESKGGNGINLFIDIVKGKNIKVGYLHEGAFLDMIFKLKPFPRKDVLRTNNCIEQMIKDLKNKN